MVKQHPGRSVGRAKRLAITARRSHDRSLPGIKLLTRSLLNILTKIKKFFVHFRVVLSSEVIHLDCLNPRKLKKDKMDSNLTLINFKSYFAKRDPFTHEYKEVESSVLVFLNEMIGKGGVAEVNLNLN